MHDIEFKVRAYLDAVNAGEATMPSHIIDDAASAFRFAMKRQFTPRPKPKQFTLRMSNIGRPLCQLQHEQKGSKAEPESYNHPIKMMLGDAAEAILIAILRAAGVNVTATGEKAVMALEVDGEVEEVFGTSDVTIDGGAGDEIWDVKSASGYSFREKFNHPYALERMQKDDPFGYLGQGIGYDEGTGKPFAGWLALSKETGELAVLELPKEIRNSLKPFALEGFKETIRVVKAGAENPGSDTPIERCFTDEAETFRKKPTGNRTLCTTCSFCRYKWDCWPDLRLERQKNSVAASPRLVYYTHLADHVSASEDAPA